MTQVGRPAESSRGVPGAMRTITSLTLMVVATLLGACGGTSGSGGGGAGCAMTATVSIAAAPAGVSPKNVCVVPGGSVTFHNTDTASHTMVLTPVPPATSCPASPTVAPSASVTVTFPTATTCKFDDQLNPNTVFLGYIAVNANTPPGY